MIGRRYGSLLAWLWIIATPSLTAGDWRELLTDPGIRAGVTLLEPGLGRQVPYGTIGSPQASAKPAWRMAQWASKYPLAVASLERLPDGALRYANAAKTVVFGPAGTPEADLSLSVLGSVEYGARARREGEAWPHLLIEQPISDPPVLTDLSELRLRLEARLLGSTLHKTADYTPRLHAATFHIFLTVQHRDPGSASNRQYLWFGIPIYDDRHEISPLYEARDSGKSDATGMYIYIPGSASFHSASARQGEWLTIDQNILPLIRDGLAAAWKQGFLAGTESFSSYRVTSLVMGWEVTGIFDVGMQVRGLRLLANPAKPPRA